MGTDRDGTAAADKFGFSVAMSGDGLSIAVGSPDRSTSRGVVRVLRWSGTAWAQRGADIEGSSPNDNLGYSVAINFDGSIVATGASNAGNKGAVRILSWATTVWSVMGSEIAGDVNGDKFGFSVALNSLGNIVAIGGPTNSGGGGGTSRGIVKVFQFVTNAWSQLGASLVGAVDGDQMGYSVALNGAGTVLAVGTPYFDLNSIADRGQ
eukprot:gene31728-38348_t